MVNDENVDAIISEIAGLDDDQISPTLYDTYSENLRKAVGQVFTRNNDSGLSDQLRANVSRFAAYKAMYITKEVRGELGNDLDMAARILRTANRTQATEYNTTISRCRTAKQFAKFSAGDNARLFPNLRWLPSRSADPREAHMLFYNKVWSKDDDFWNENTPGSLWNCKCDWEETDDPVTENNPQGDKSAQGLRGNPASTGEVFSKDHIYINPKDADMLVDCYFKDDRSELMISALADKTEISDNISTGRILSLHFNKVSIRPHLQGKDVPNPEFEIDGLIADAKRVKSEKGISDAFRSGKSQGCQIIIVDYNKHNVKITDITSRNLGNRHEDFINGNISYCYIVSGKDVIQIDNSIFLKHKDVADKKRKAILIKEDLRIYIKEALQKM